METGYMEADLIENAFLVVKDGLIHSVTRNLANVAVPPDATIFDAHGCKEHAHYYS
jgi:imidazolonepropionase-like amidohydrolase